MDESLTHRLTPHEIAENLPLWSRSFVDWSEGPFGFYVNQVWDDRRKLWTKKRQPVRWDTRQAKALRYCLTLNDDGKLPVSELWWVDIGKSGKTMLQAAVAQWMGLFIDTEAELLLTANSREQAGIRAYGELMRSCRRNPYMAPYVTLPAEGAATPGPTTFAFTKNVARPVPLNAGSQAGTNPVFRGIDEIWAYEGDAAQAMIAEFKESPARNISFLFVSTYLGFEGEATPLNKVLDGFFDEYELPRANVSQPIPDIPLYIAGGVAVWWNHDPYPWHTPEFMQKQRENLANTESHYLRVWEARRVQRTDTYIPIERWDMCEDPTCEPADRGGRGRPMVLGLDLGVKDDHSAVVGRALNPVTGRYELTCHRIWEPGDFMMTGRQVEDVIQEVENTILDWHYKHNIIAVYFDPTQGYHLAGRLKKAGVNMVEVAQSGKGREMADTNYRLLILGRLLRNYPESWDLREHVRRAVGRETRGGAFRMDKRLTSQKIDGAIADALACYGCNEERAAFERAVRRRRVSASPAPYRGMRTIRKAIYGRP